MPAWVTSEMFDINLDGIYYDVMSTLPPLHMCSRVVTVDGEQLLRT